MQRLDFDLAGQPERFLHAQDIGGLQRRVGIREVDPGATVVDDIDRSRQRL